MLRVGPSRQCFDADDPRTVRRHDRLVVDVDIFACKRALELALQFAAIVEFQVHARIENNQAAAAAAFRNPQREIRATDQVVTRHPM